MQSAAADPGFQKKRGGVHILCEILRITVFGLSLTLEKACAKKEGAHAPVPLCPRPSSATDMYFVCMSMGHLQLIILLIQMVILPTKNHFDLPHFDSISYSVCHTKEILGQVLGDRIASAGYNLLGHTVSCVLRYEHRM